MILKLICDPDPLVFSEFLRTSEDKETLTFKQ